MPPKKPKHQTHLASLNSARKSVKLPTSTPKTATKQTSLLDFHFNTPPKPPPSKPPLKRRRGKLPQEEVVEIPETQVETRNDELRREEGIGSETESEPEAAQDGGVTVMEEDLGSETESDLDDDAPRLEPVWVTPRKKKIPPTTVIPETPEAVRMQAWRKREGRVSPTPRGKRRRTRSVSPVREEVVAGRDGRGGTGGAGKRTPRRTMTPVGRDMPARGSAPVGTATTPRSKITPSRGKSMFPRTPVSAEIEVEPQLEADSDMVVGATSSRLTPPRREEPGLARDDEEERVAKAGMDVEMGDGTEDQAEEEREEPREERYPRDRVIPSSQWWEREGSLSEDEGEPEPTLAPPPPLQLQSEIPSPLTEEATRSFAALETSPLEEHAPTQPEHMEDAGQEDGVMADSAPAASPASRPPLPPGSSTMSYFDTQFPETQAPETQSSALFSFPPPSPPPPNSTEPMRPPLLPGSSTMSYTDTHAPETTSQNAPPPSQSVPPPPTQPFLPSPRIKPEPEPSQPETQYPDFRFNPIHTQMPSQIPMSSQSPPPPPSPSPTPSLPSPSPPATPPRRIKREPSSPSPLRVKLEPETQVPEFPFNPVHTQYPDFPASSQAPSSPQQEEEEGGWRSPVYTPAQTVLGRRFGEEGRNGGRGEGRELADSQLLPEELMATFPMPPEWTEVEDEEEEEGEGEGSPTQ